MVTRGRPGVPGERLCSLGWDGGGPAVVFAVARSYPKHHKTPSSRPKAAHFAAAMERPPHFAFAVAVACFPYQPKTLGCPILRMHSAKGGMYTLDSPRFAFAVACSPPLTSTLCHSERSEEPQYFAFAFAVAVRI